MFDCLFGGFPLTNRTSACGAELPIFDPCKHGIKQKLFTLKSLSKPYGRVIDADLKLITQSGIALCDGDPAIDFEIADLELKGEFECYL